MSEDAFSFPACVACGHALWPPRPVCPRCGGTEFAPRSAAHGVVEEVTSTGEAAFASVRAEAGPIVLARLAGEAVAGTAIELRWAAAAAGSGRYVLATPTVSERDGSPRRQPRDPTSRD